MAKNLAICGVEHSKNKEKNLHAIWLFCHMADTYSKITAILLYYLKALETSFHLMCGMPMSGAMNIPLIRIN